MSKWWERFPTNDTDRAEQYEEAKKLRDRAWAEMSVACSLLRSRATAELLPPEAMW